MEESNLRRRKRDVLPAHVLAGIAEGQEDSKAGNTFTFEEFKQQVSITDNLITKKANILHRSYHEL